MAKAAFNVHGVVDVDTKRMQAGMRAAEQAAARAAAKIARNFKSAGEAMSAIGGRLAAFGGVAFAGIAATSKSLLDLADSAGDAAERLGTTAETMSRLMYAAAGTDNLNSLEAMTRVVDTMSKRIGGAIQGTGKLEAVIARMGLTAADFARMPLTDQLAAIADAMANMKTPAERAALAMDVFGRGGAEMVNVLQAGGAAFRQTMADASRFGAVLDEELVAAAGALEKTTIRLAGASRTLFITVLKPALPTLQRIAEAAVRVAGALTDWAARNPRVAASIAGIGVAAVGIAGALGALAFAVAPVVTAIGSLGLGGALAGLSSAMITGAAVCAPWALALGSLAAAAVLLSDAIGATNTGLLDFIRNASAVRKATDSLYIGFKMLTGGDVDSAIEGSVFMDEARAAAGGGAKRTASTASSAKLDRMIALLEQGNQQRAQTGRPPLGSNMATVPTY